jgi:hypothetical protein
MWISCLPSMSQSTNTHLSTLQQQGQRLQVLRCGRSVIGTVGLARAWKNNPASSSSLTSSISSGIGCMAFEVPSGDLPVQNISSVLPRMHATDRPVGVFDLAAMKVTASLSALLSCKSPSIASLLTSGVPLKCPTKGKLRL